ncbi:MAG TPA: hypothetical protein VK826_14940 [Bacteroidia bacterium]|nr:hypothetical protein [Bacteroidia bacterium]
MEDIKLAEIALVNDSAHVKLNVTIRNKGFWHFHLTKVRIRVYDDTLLIMTYASDSSKVLSRNQFKVEELYLTIPLQRVIQRIKDHQGQDSVKLKFTGEFTYSTIFGDLERTLDEVISVKVPIPPKLYIRQVEYIGRDDGVYDLVLHAMLHNQNARELEMKNVAYEMFGENLIAMHGFLSSIVIAAQDSTAVNIPVKMEVNHELGIISRIVFDNDVIDYSFVMKGVVVSFTDVVDEDVPVTISSYGHVELYDKDRKNRPKFTRRKNKRQRAE